MKLKKIFSGAGILALCAALAKLLGALYRIPLTNIIGAHGIGLYQMVFPLYTVLLTVSSGGLSTAISKVVAACLAKNNQQGALKILKVSLVALITVSSIATIFLVAFRDRIALIQGNELASLAYLAIAPSVILVAAISCFRGYFQGRGNMLPSGLSQIIEQVVKLVLGLYLAARLNPYGVEYAVLGAVLGVSLSEFVALIVLAIQFLLHYFSLRKKRIIKIGRLNLNFEIAQDFAIFSEIPSLSSSQILKSLYKIAIPVTLGSLVMPLTQVIDSIMVINVLVADGALRSDATSLFGLVSGPINSLINMPVVITLSFSVALLPKFSYLSEQGKDASKAVAQTLRLTMLITLPATVILMAFSRQIVTALYSRGLSIEQLDICSSLLRIESLSVFYLGIVQTATAVLQGADKPHRPAINLLYGATAKVLLTLFLLPFLGIKGAAIATVVCYATIALIDLKYMLQIVKPKLNLIKSFVMPLLACIIMLTVSIFSLWILNRIIKSLFALIISLAIGGIFYGLFLLITKTVTIKEIIR